MEASRPPRATAGHVQNELAALIEVEPITIGR
jgi:hypothetical protein